MKIFVTKELKRTVKKNYKVINKEVLIIDVEELARNFDVVDYENNIYAKFILHQEIKKQFKYSYFSKRFKNVLYIAKDIDKSFIDNLKKFLDINNIYFTEFILIDYSMAIDPSLYLEFQNVI